MAPAPEFTPCGIDTGQDPEAFVRAITADGLGTWGREPGASAAARLAAS